MGIKPRLETEAQGTSEMAYFGPHDFIDIPGHLKFAISLYSSIWSKRVLVSSDFAISRLHY